MKWFLNMVLHEILEIQVCFCNFFVILCTFRTLFSCLENRSATLWTCTKSQKGKKITKKSFLPVFHPSENCGKIGEKNWWKKSVKKIYKKICEKIGEKICEKLVKICEKKSLKKTVKKICEKICEKIGENLWKNLSKNLWENLWKIGKNLWKMVEKSVKKIGEKNW